MSRAVRVVRTLSLGLALALGAGQASAAGALAIDSNQGDQYGFAYSYADAAQAQARALNECGDGCQVVLHFAKECAAYAADQASGSSVDGWATATFSSDAQSSAVSLCQKQGGSSCIVRVWGCDD